MNENAKKWVAALRSGKYKQGVGYLHQIDEEGKNFLCCLGVACEIYREENEDLEAVIRDNVSHRPAVISYNGSSAILPDKVKNWLGLNYKEGMFEEGETSLADKNDSGSSFEEIADIIESEPEGLFNR